MIFNWKLVTQVLATIGKELSKLFTWNLWGMPILLVGIATLGVILWAISYNGAVTATKKAKHKKEERLNKAQQ